MQLLALFWRPVSVPRLVLAWVALSGHARTAAAGPPDPAAQVREALSRLALQELIVVSDDRSAFACHPHYLEPAARSADEEDVLPYLVRIVIAALRSPLQEEPRRGPGRPRNVDRSSWLTPKDPVEPLCDLRMALRGNNADLVLSAMSACDMGRQVGSPLEGTPWRVCMQPFDPRWFDRINRKVAANLALIILRDACKIASPLQDLIDWVEQRLDTFDEEVAWRIRLHLSTQLVLQGNFDRALAVLETTPDSNSNLLRGWIAFLRGDDSEAVRLYEEAVRLSRTGKPTDAGMYINFPSAFYPFALLLDPKPVRKKRAQAILKCVLESFSGPMKEEFRLLKCMGEILEVGCSTERWEERLLDSGSPLAVLLRALVSFWNGPSELRPYLAALEGCLEDARANGLSWLAMEHAEILARVDPTPERVARAATLREKVGARPLVGLIARAEPWERTLDTLCQIAEALPGRGSSTTASQRRTRLAWWLVWSETHGVTALQPREQKLGADGQWSLGRNVALKRLWEQGTTLDFLLDADRSICGAIRYENDWYSGTAGHTLNIDKAIPFLVDHPHLYWSDAPQVKVEFTRNRPALRVTQEGGRLLLGLEPPPPDSGRSYAVVREGPGTLRLFEYGTQEVQIHALLRAGGNFPNDACERVLDVVGRFAGHLSIHSDVGGVAAEQVPADGRLHIDLTPSNPGLRVDVRIYPFGSPGPSQVPGKGSRTVVTEKEGRHIEACRDLQAEKSALQTLLESCPTLEGAEGERDAGQWLVSDPESCLQMLEDMRSTDVVLQWPQGGRMDVRHGTFKSRPRVVAQRDWFAATADMELDDGWVLGLRDLLEALRETRGRYLPLGDGQFLALTDKLRRQLEDVAAFSEIHGDGVKFHPLAALAVEEAFRDLGGLDADRAFRRHMDRLAAPCDASLPTTFQADLRDYQREGFTWLARLSALGLGACLADDMGLGKTVQALAVLLLRAAGGPALVVAPTSVCTNWMEEAARFAPTLTPRLFSGSDREARLGDLGPYDVLVCSYALLQQSAEALAAVSWHSVVLDEAQAIKNAHTQRSQAAMALRAGFRLVTTGTPVENHLGELWNLFRFLNPGLLGSNAAFNQRFAVPIERDADRAARNRLKKLVTPFILRRTKTQVLEELPPRTDITLHVDLSPEERALYEAVRQRAVEKLEDAEVASGPGQIQILAEITRLRRACCHPRLVLPDSPMKSSRLQAFADVVAELLDNHHKALVFSQFVDHLSLVREHLDASGIRYQYLDGSTPPPDRARAVAAFQAGEGDLFLISLRAGGTGLNLTAADYVIHLDPWWNPAVEDQASDRAHRIGQERPVTVYRLVARDTIEDTIVDLHRHKRDLADAVLDGTDVAARLSGDALLKLIREEALAR